MKRRRVGLEPLSRRRAEGLWAGRERHGLAFEIMDDFHNFGFGNEPGISREDFRVTGERAGVSFAGQSGKLRHGCSGIAIGRLNERRLYTCQKIPQGFRRFAC